MTTPATDAELLDRFVRRQDLSAFETLLRRHGPMVLQVCQRVLHHPQDAEDAFQATFVVLVKKAGSIAQPELVGGWLHGVAQRVAMKARSQSARRQAREQPLQQPVAQDGAEPGWHEVSPLLDEELNQLPDKYRTPLVLCYLEGKTNDQAAEQLGWTRGQVAGQLARGRDLLRQRLSRRGLTLSAAALAALVSQHAAQALPPALANAALQTATTGGAATAVALAEGIASTGISAKIAVGAVAAVLALAGGVAYFMQKPPQDVMTLQSFDGPAMPVNRAGEEYPNPYQPGNGGQFTASIQADDAVAGSALRLRVLDGWLKAQFDPNEAKGRSFTRQFTQQPANWRLNHYNRLRFWVKLPPEAPPHPTNGRANMGLGTYVKRVRDADPHGLDTGGGQFFHLFNVPATGQWTQVVLNMHPNWRDGPTAEDIGNQPHPTGEADANYFDAMTRFFLEARAEPNQYPADYWLDELEFYHEAATENDDQVYSITATHVPEQQRIILTWNRRIGEDAVHHEVRFAFQDIHALGWDAAQPAPAGRVRPPGTRELNGMVYDTTALPVQGNDTLYLAIKPENAVRFSQVAIRLTRK